MTPEAVSTSTSTDALVLILGTPLYPKGRGPRYYRQRYRTVGNFA